MNWLLKYIKENTKLKAKNLFYKKFPNQQRDIIDLAGQGNVFLLEQEYVDIFRGYPWSFNYGGERWVDITKTLFKLMQIQTSFSTKEAELIIDHAFDLIHNTNSIFTKDNEVVKWILSALDIKKNTSPLYYMKECTNDVQKLLKKYYRNELSQFNSFDQNIKIEKAIGIKSLINNYVNSTGGKSLYLLDNLHLNYKLYSLIVNLTAHKSSAKYSKHILYINFNIDKINNFIELFKLSPEFSAIGKYLTTELYKFLAANLDNNTLKQINDYFALEPNSNASTWLNIINNVRNRKKIAKISSVQLNNTLFFDFYAMNYIDCNILDEDDKNVCKFIKKDNCIQIIEYLVSLLKKCIMKEAAHVNDAWDSSI